VQWQLQGCLGCAVDELEEQGEREVVHELQEGEDFAFDDEEKDIEDAMRMGKKVFRKVKLRKVQFSSLNSREISFSNSQSQFSILNSQKISISILLQKSQIPTSHFSNPQIQKVQARVLATLVLSGVCTCAVDVTWFAFVV